MKCIKCNSNALTETYFMEASPCPHCDGDIEVEYHICHQCNVAWKTMNNKIVSTVNLKDVDTVFSNIDEQTVGFNIANSAGPMDGPVMGELVHRCIKCNSIAFEIASKRWKCNDPDCQFEWEVIDCE